MGSYAMLTPGGVLSPQGPQEVLGTTPLLVPQRKGMEHHPSCYTATKEVI